MTKLKFVQFNSAPLPTPKCEDHDHDYHVGYVRYVSIEANDTIAPHMRVQACMKHRIVAKSIAFVHTRRQSCSTLKLSSASNVEVPCPSTGRVVVASCAPINTVDSKERVRRGGLN